MGLLIFFGSENIWVCYFFFVHPSTKYHGFISKGSRVIDGP